MVVSELLYVGKGPEDPAPYGGPIHASTATQAAALVRDRIVAVVPTTEIAKNTLVLLGYGTLWATFATERRGNVSEDELSL